MALPLPWRRGLAKGTSGSGLDRASTGEGQRPPVNPGREPARRLGQGLEADPTFERISVHALRPEQGSKPHGCWVSDLSRKFA
jgi:hypothetical protein